MLLKNRFKMSTDAARNYQEAPCAAKHKHGIFGEDTLHFAKHLLATKGL